MSNKISYLSPSQINAFLDCPRKWYATYVLKAVPYKESADTQLGNVFHKIMELCTAAEINGMEEKYRNPENYINAMMGKTITSSQQRRDGKGRPANDLLTEDRKALLPIFCRNVDGFGWKDHKGDMTKIEHPMEYYVDGVKIIGRIDRVDISKNHVKIIDFKTGKPYTEDKISDDWQTKLYAYPFLLEGKMVNFEFWFVRNTDGKKKVSFHPDDAEGIRTGLEKIIKEVKSETGDNWKTSGLCTKYCGYYEECIKRRG